MTCNSTYVLLPVPSCRRPPLAGRVGSRNLSARLSLSLIKADAFPPASATASRGFGAEMKTAFVPNSDDYRFPRSAHRGISSSFPENLAIARLNKNKSVIDRSALIPRFGPHDVSAPFMIYYRLNIHSRRLP
ncbi:hypothetical protein DD509_07285 [Dehalogenimonas alkenigignens]|nr:hypothetical protein DD509_07285 [Dehalogenimonas alkenigignens]